jgi:hypothetical protein
MDALFNARAVTVIRRLHHEPRAATRPAAEAGRWEILRAIGIAVPD